MEKTAEIEIDLIWCSMIITISAILNISMRKSLGSNPTSSHSGFAEYSINLLNVSLWVVSFTCYIVCPWMSELAHLALSSKRIFYGDILADLYLLIQGVIKMCIPISWNVVGYSKSFGILICDMNNLSKLWMRYC